VVLNQTKPIIVITDPGLEEEVAVRLGRIGFDHMAGYLDGGMQPLSARPDLVCRTDRITAPTLAEQLTEADAPTVLDVRAPGEWAEGHISGSVNLPLTFLQSRLNEIPEGHPIVVHCAGGYRSAIAISILEGHGVTGVVDLVGGLGAWEASKLETVR
jgi:hydroxyacylglutathione hydrolase